MVREMCELHFGRKYAYLMTLFYLKPCHLNAAVAAAATAAALDYFLPSIVEACLCKKLTAK